ncbi:MAG: cytidine deaminase [Eubacterium sp.]|nr:cytidine deaminase [Eubacterium sp.]MCM1214398.1 cytidine deaminase [Lachnospiraceae bacterium]MCM1304479.1 cytidine deaminase [Butyrivibrio sp.]MCM1342597.1 cytidine deaminase [Muribaculaceae bacterium]MCM1238688.1 cytidine deaminase [Lachnospiraceae bacterium]
MTGRMNDREKQELIQKALEARRMAYAPYSHYLVGAALFTEDGSLYQGGNIENASYGATNCAERTAVFKAVSDGKRRIKALAVAGGLEGSDPTDYAYPCGICRQVLQEFGTEDTTLLIARSVTDYREFGLKELLPFGFGGESIK